MDKSEIKAFIAKRVAKELKDGDVVNLGIGIPEYISMVANEEGIAQRITLSLESGPQGGVPVEGAGFGSAVNAEAIYTVADTLELYDGGMLDLSFLGAAEVDCHGNVNVSAAPAPEALSTSPKIPNACFLPEPLPQAA
mgnify:CR=1 FL=1